VGSDGAESAAINFPELFDLLDQIAERQHAHCIAEETDEKTAKLAILGLKGPSLRSAGETVGL